MRVNCIVLLLVNTFPQANRGIGLATSIRVGQILGSGNGRAANSASRVGITISGE